MAQQPQTLYFRILKIIFKVLLIFSTSLMLLGVFTLWIGLIALQDEVSHRERADEDVAALKIVITLLFISLSLGSLQTILGWIGIIKTRLRFLMVYFVIEVMCFVLWFLIFAFAESKSGPSYSLASSLLRLIVSQLIIRAIKSFMNPKAEEVEIPGEEEADTAVIQMDTVTPIDHSCTNGRIVHVSTITASTEENFHDRFPNISTPPLLPLPEPTPQREPPTESLPERLDSTRYSHDDNVNADKMDQGDKEAIDSNFAENKRVSNEGR
jgi:hypothetical protein